MRVRRSLLNFGSSALMLAVTMAVAIKATPLLIAWLGPTRYGAARIVTDAYGYLTLLELGLGGALGPLLARAAGRSDEVALKETVAAGSRAYLVVVIAVLAVGLAMTPLVHRLVNGLSPQQLADLRRAWLVGLAGFLPLVVLPMRYVVEARQFGFVVNLLLIGQSLLITGTSLVLAKSGWGITGQAVAQVVGAWAFGLILTVGVVRSHPGLLRAVLSTRVSPETRRALRHLSGPSLILGLSGRVGLLSDNLVVGALRSSDLVTSLVNTQKLAAIGQTVLQAVGGACWAGLAELYTLGENAIFNRRLVEITRVVAVIGVVVLVPVVAYNRAFFGLWLGGSVAYGGEVVNALSALNAVLLAEQSLWAWCFNATGKARSLVLLAVVIAGVNIAVSVVMTRWLGIAGPLIGTTVALVGVGLWAFPLLLRAEFGTPVVPLLSALALPLAAGAAVCWGLCRWTRTHEPAGWMGLAAEMSAVSAVLGAVGVGLLITPEDRTLWRRRLAGLRGSAS